MRNRRHNDTVPKNLRNYTSFKDEWRLIGICWSVWLWIPNACSNRRNDALLSGIAIVQE